MTVLLAEGITKRYAGVDAVVDVDCKIDAGEVVGIIGPNGAGKTTLFNILSRLETPSDGKVFLDGMDISSLRIEELVGKGLGRTQQTPGIFHDLTCRENIQVALLAPSPWNIIASFLYPSRDIDRSALRANEILQRVGLYDKADVIAENLPFGQRRILEVGRVLATNPRIVLFDEPGAGLSELEIRWLADTVRSLKGDGVGIGLIEHNMELIMGVADRLIVLDRGRVLFSGLPEAARANRDVREAYLGGGIPGGSHTPR